MSTLNSNLLDIRARELAPLFVIFLLSIVHPLFAQKIDKTTDDKSSPLKSMELQQQKFDVSQFDVLKQLEPMAGTGTIYNDQLFEGPVDVNKYIVGPNDIFSLGIWGILNQAIPIIVSPEGSLIIPSVGELQVAGLTLSEAKQRVIEKVRRRYISSEISLTLISPRRFTIMVTGVGQGTYPTSATLRASAIISYIFFDSTSLMKSGTSKGERTRFSLRNITLTRKNGEKTRIDLLKYYAERDDRYNPFLREGDVINLPKYDYDGRYLSVFGAVQFPGSFEYIEGDDLETAIQLVRGMTTSANPDSILISRLNADAKKMHNFIVKYDGNEHMKLQINDRVVVMTYTDLRRDYKVTILGEVYRPGQYPITSDQTHLSEIISQAGGFAPDAFLPTSEVYRRIDSLFLPNTLYQRDSLEFIYTQRLNDIVANKDEKEQFELETKSRIGRINVDFVRLYEKNDLTQDVMLRDNDIVYISNNKKAVYVYGQVNKSGFVPFKEGADYQYYIDAAGGLGERADESEIRVIKFKTRQWLDPDDATIESNDFIYVPKIIKRDFAYDIDLIAKVAAVLASVITLTLLIIQAQK